MVSFFLKDSLQEGTQILLLYSKAATACVPVLVGQCVVLQHTPSSSDHDMIRHIQSFLKEGATDLGTRDVIPKVELVPIAHSVSR